MTVVAGAQHDSWVTLVPGDGPDPATRDADPIFFDGKALRNGVAAYRIRGQEGRLAGTRPRDRTRSAPPGTDHLRAAAAGRQGRRRGRRREGARSHRRVLVAGRRSGVSRGAARADGARAGAGRGAGLAGRAEEAAAVLDDVLRRTPLRGDAVLARAATFLLAGDAEKALTLAEAGTAIPDVPARVHYLAGPRARRAGEEGRSGRGAAQVPRRSSPTTRWPPASARRRRDRQPSPWSRRRWPRRTAPGRGLRFSATADKGARRQRRVRLLGRRGRSRGGSPASRRRPRAACCSTSRPDACCARTARPSAARRSCWSSARRPVAPMRWRARARATSSRTPSSRRCRRCMPGTRARAVPRARRGGHPPGRGHHRDARRGWSTSWS